VFVPAHRSVPLSPLAPDRRPRVLTPTGAPHASAQAILAQGPTLPSSDILALVRAQPHLVAPFAWTTPSGTHRLALWVRCARLHLAPIHVLLGQGLVERSPGGKRHSLAMLEHTIGPHRYALAPCAFVLDPAARATMPDRGMGALHAVAFPSARLYDWLHEDAEAALEALHDMGPALPVWEARRGQRVAPWLPTTPPEPALRTLVALLHGTLDTGYPHIGGLSIRAGALHPDGTTTPPTLAIDGLVQPRNREEVTRLGGWLERCLSGQACPLPPGAFVAAEHTALPLALDTKPPQAPAIARLSRRDPTPSAHERRHRRHLVAQAESWT